MMHVGGDGSMTMRQCEALIEAMDWRRWISGPPRFIKSSYFDQILLGQGAGQTEDAAFYNLRRAAQGLQRKTAHQAEREREAREMADAKKREDFVSRVTMRVIAYQRIGLGVIAAEQATARDLNVSVMEVGIALEDGKHIAGERWAS